MLKVAKRPADYILPLYMSGLAGRMLKLPAANKKKKREILLIAGQHTSIERIYSMAEYLSRYGSITSPDLPGFGGMEPFYKIGEKPDLDTMASYLAAFIKFRYKKGRFTIVAVSYGLTVVTRMMQLYPEIAKRTDLVISIAGLVDKDDFRWKRFHTFWMRSLCSLLSMAVPGSMVRFVFIRQPVIRSLYRIAERKHPKLKGAAGEDRQSRINFEIELWKQNDFRTWMATCRTMLTVRLAGRAVPLKVCHIAIKDDHYFDHTKVEEHMRKIFKNFEMIKIKLPAHAPTVLATPKDVAPFVPPRVRSLLRAKV